MGRTEREERKATSSGMKENHKAGTLNMIKKNLFWSYWPWKLRT
jgi:hypothetical protein